MKTLIHVCIDIRGTIWNRHFDGINHEDGTPMTAREAFNALCDELVKGRRVLPCGECDNFDFQKGCLGHQIAEDVA
jgi:hypothetical protein